MIQGATPLIFASQMNQIEIVKLLLGAEGIEINQPSANLFGCTTAKQTYRNRSTS